MSTLSLIPVAVKTSLTRPESYTPIPMGVGPYIDAATAALIDSSDSAERVEGFRLMRLAMDAVAARYRKPRADDLPQVGYTPDDAQWWAEHCDHAGWPLDGELSPEEQDAELDHAAWLESQYKAAFEQDRYENGIVCW